MFPDRLSFLNKFDNFYQVITNAVKEDKLNERDFYLIIIAKAKSMNQERREKTLLLNEGSDQRGKRDKSNLFILGELGDPVNFFCPFFI